MDNIQLRALTESDIVSTLKWNNQSDIKDLYAGHPFPVNYEMEKQWFNNITQSNFPITVFGIELLNNNKLIGLSFLKNIDLIHRKAEFAIYIGETKERGKGYSKEATKKTLEFGFYQLGLNRIYLYVQKNNANALKLYESAGFKMEGELKDSIFKNGSFRDEIIMAILKKDSVK